MQKSSLVPEEQADMQEADPEVLKPSLNSDAAAEERARSASDVAAEDVV